MGHQNNTTKHWTPKQHNQTLSKQHNQTLHTKTTQPNITRQNNTTQTLDTKTTQPNTEHQNNTTNHWTPKQHNQTAQLKAGKYPTFHCSVFFRQIVKKCREEIDHLQQQHQQQQQLQSKSIVDEGFGTAESQATTAATTVISRTLAGACPEKESLEPKSFREE